MIKKLKKIGQIGIATALIGGSFALLGSVIAAWATASNKIAGTETRISVVAERENNHYAEIERRFDETNRRFDKIDGRFDKLESLIKNQK